MRRLSREAIDAALARADSEVNILRAGLNCACNGEVNWFARVVRREDRTSFRFGVAELTRVHGGLFFTQSRVRQADGKWDRPYTCVRYLEEMYGEATRCAYWQLEHVQRAMRLREAAYQELEDAITAAGDDHPVEVQS